MALGFKQTLDMVLKVDLEEPFPSMKARTWDILKGKKKLFSLESLMRNLEE